MRLALVALVGFLAVSTSGLVDLLVPEPCAITESTPDDHGDCGTACIRCHCGSPAIHFGALQLASQTLFPTDFEAPVQTAAAGIPSEILHVPLS